MVHKKKSGRQPIKLMTLQYSKKYHLLNTVQIIINRLIAPYQLLLSMALYCFHVTNMPSLVACWYSNCTRTTNHDHFHQHRVIMLLVRKREERSTIEKWAKRHYVYRIIVKRRLINKQIVKRRISLSH